MPPVCNKQSVLGLQSQERLLAEFQNTVKTGRRHIPGGRSFDDWEGEALGQFCLGSGQNCPRAADVIPSPKIGTFLGLLNAPQQGAEANQAIS